MIRQTTGQNHLIDQLTFNNDGTVEVNAGTLELDNVTGLNTGYFDTQAGAKVIFSHFTVFTFDPNINDTATYMMRGDGWYVAQATGDVRIPEFAVVQADNFELALEGFLSGLGTFQPGNFLWTGGTMMSDIASPALGVTELVAGSNMTIDAVTNVTLNGREIRNRGTINWGSPGDIAGDIFVDNGGTIVNDGGVFHVWNDRSILNLNNTAGKLIVQNGGQFIDHLTEYLYTATTTIDIPFENNGGIIHAEGNLAFNGGFTSEHNDAVTHLYAGAYTSPSSLLVNAGLLNLVGGTVATNQPAATSILLVAVGANVSRFTGWGEVLGDVQSEGGITELSGNLTVRTFAQSLLGAGSTLRLHGHTLTTTNDFFWNGPSSTVDLGGGTLTSTAATGLRAVNESGTMRGPGTINGHIRNRGTIDVNGTLTHNGPLDQQATGVLNVGTGTYTNSSAEGVDNQGTIRGTGTINGRVRNRNGGRIQTGGGNQVGALSLAGNFIQDAGAELNIELSATGHSQFQITGHATLGGTLAVTLLGGYLPSGDEQFTVMTFTTKEGSFENDTVALEDGLYFDVLENATNVVLGAVNLPPVAVNDSYEVAYNQTLLVAAPGVLSIDSDPGNDSLTAQLVNGPSNVSSFTLNSDGSFSYTPVNGFTGNDSFTYKAHDGNSSSNLATVTIFINSPPVATDDSYIVDAGDTLNVSAPGVLDNDSDADNDPLTAVLVAGPSNGAVTLNANGSFTYTPNANFSGTDSFTYKANDGLDSSAAATVTITVTDVNPDPQGASSSSPLDELFTLIASEESVGPVPSATPLVTVKAGYADSQPQWWLAVLDHQAEDDETNWLTDSIPTEALMSLFDETGVAGVSLAIEFASPLV